MRPQATEGKQKTGGSTKPSSLLAGLSLQQAAFLATPRQLAYSFSFLLVAIVFKPDTVSQAKSAAGAAVGWLREVDMVTLLV